MAKSLLLVTYINPLSAQGSAQPSWLAFSLQIQKTVKQALVNLILYFSVIKKRAESGKMPKSGSNCRLIKVTNLLGSLQIGFWYL
ncbi:MAG: hypothetical protein ACJAWT_000867 [Glaciecola sp.]|jgi:hypothetical protein